ncbi:MAG: N-acetylmannosamine kinase [Myxococcota bacterium]|nr:N-acetylmannosamine kinase [Myxococcota bacterium]
MPFDPEQYKHLFREKKKNPKRGLKRPTRAGARDPIVIGADVGGSTIRAALIDNDGSLLDRLDVPTPRDDGNALVRELARVCGMLIEKHPRVTVRAVGVGVAAWVTNPEGIAIQAPNIGMRNFPLRKRLKQLLRTPVVILNDVDAACRGECAVGAGAGNANVFCVFVGTGVGSGMTIAGQPYRGATGVGGELGHVKMIASGGELCGCGDRGCLETLAGGRAIERLILESNQERPDSILAKKTAASGAASAAALQAALEEECPEAARIAAGVSGVLGLAIANALALLEPDVLVLGGGVIQNCPALFRLTCGAIRHHAAPSLKGRMRIDKAMLWDHAGFMGAGFAALRLIHAEQPRPAPPAGKQSAPAKPVPIAGEE